MRSRSTLKRGTHRSQNTPTKARRPALSDAAKLFGLLKSHGGASIAHLPEHDRAKANGSLDIGRRVRELREQAQLSQRQLADRAGVTHATIANIESNKSSPSVATLRKILDVTGLSFSEFFVQDVPDADRVFLRKDELTLLSDGDLTFRQIGPGRQGKARLLLLHETYEPGADTGAEMLQHDAEEAGIVIRGSIEVTVGARTEILSAGDAYYFRSTEPHRFRNTGRTVCVIVSACTPPYL